MSPAQFHDPYLENRLHHDGRVYPQKTTDVDQRLFYDNVVVPVVNGK